MSDLAEEDTAGTAESCCYWSTYHWSTTDSSPGRSGWPIAAGDDSAVRRRS